ncbi:RNA-binding domain-containing protein [Fusicatenibacter faecihominis]|uniref:DNA binding domain-containing protein n=1 Tax=Fusicatenibacter faecihominis TaxID=2881276 RepID=A0AAE3J7H7_9FIRM|nr:putative DNA binding domain-containing protein [Fusicatenibacter faecihominis]
MKSEKEGLIFLSFFFIIKRKKWERKERSMLLFENQNIEFKQEYVPDIRKEVIGFANAEGGTVYVGIRKDGKVLGVEDPDGVMLQIVNSLKDALAPDIMPFVRVNSVEIEGKQVVEINVTTGTNRPYYLREKGLKPSGVYVRKGSSTQPMTEEGIREMILQNSGRSFELCRSMNQELTFHTLQAEMQKRLIELGTSQMRTLKLIGEDGLYTNLALLLSDQCETTTKVALFQGTDKEVFRDRKEFTGSILKQLEEVYQFINLLNKTKATFSGLDRTDMRDYPEEAVRESLLNSIVHRDYSFSGSNLVNIYENRMEFVSLGGLVSGLELKSIFLGVSQSRNPNLAAVFYRMRLIESYGTGIGKIERAYKTYQFQPEFETAKGVFRVTLPNRNEKQEREERAKDHVDTMVSLNEQKSLIVQYAKENGSVTRKEVEDLIGAGTTKAFRLLKELCEAGKLEQKGKGKLSTYVIK